MSMARRYSELGDAKCNWNELRNGHCGAVLGSLFRRKKHV